MWLTLSFVATRHIIRKVPFYAILCTCALIKCKQAGTPKAQNSDFWIIHRAIAMWMDALAWLVTINADAVHWVQCTIKQTKLVQGIGKWLLLWGQRLPHETPAAS